MLNIVTLMGRMTNKPETRQVNNTTVCRFTLAVQRNRKDASGQYQTDFIDCVCFGKTGQFVSTYFDKGSMAAVCGTLQTSTWQDKNGNNRKSVEAVVNECHFGESKRNAQNTQAYPQSDPYAPINSDFAQMPDDMDDGSVPF